MSSVLDVLGAFGWTKKPTRKVQDAIWTVLAQLGATPEERRVVVLRAAATLVEEFVPGGPPAAAEELPEASSLDDAVAVLAAVVANVCGGAAVEQTAAAQRAVADAAAATKSRQASLETAPVAHEGGRTAAANAREEIKQIVAEALRASLPAGGSPTPRAPVVIARAPRCSGCGCRLSRCCCVPASVLAAAARSSPQARAPAEAPAGQGAAGTGAERNETEQRRKNPPTHPSTSDSDSTRTTNEKTASERSTTETTTTAAAATGHKVFRDPAVAFEPARWRDALREAPAEELEKELLRQTRAHKIEPRGGFTEAVAEMCAELCAEWGANPGSERIPEVLLSMLWRCAAFGAEGATPQECEEMLRKFRAERLPKRWREGVAKLKKATARRKEHKDAPRKTPAPANQPQHYKTGAGRIPPHIWATMSAEARAEAVAKRRR